MFKIKALALTIISALLVSSAGVANAEEQPIASVSPEKIDSSVSLTSTENIFDESQTVLKDTTPASIPSQPASLFLYHETSTTATIGWEAPTSNGGETITSYRIGVSLDNINFQYFSTASTYISFSGMVQNTKYYFAVQAMNASGYGPAITGYLVTPYNTETPTAPFGLETYNITDTSVDLSWIIPSSSGTQLTKYVISYSTDNINWTSQTINSSYVVYESATLSGLTKGTDYYVRIAGVNSNGQGTWSSSVNLKTTGTLDTVPTSPLSLSVKSANSYSISLSWLAPTSNGGKSVTDYIVQYKANSSSTWLTYNDGVSTATSTVVKNLIGATTYNFKIAAVNSIGTSVYTTPISKATTAKTIPQAIGNLKITGGTASSIKIEWTVPSNDGGSPITDYVIQYKRSTSTTWTTVADGISTNAVATASGLSAGILYNYRVAAKNAVGTGNYVTKNITMSVPSTPTGFAITGKTFNSVSIAHTHVLDSTKPFIYDTIVQYRKTGTTTWITFADGTGATTSTNITGLLSNTSYDFRVASRNTYGTSTYTTLLTTTTNASTPASPPTALTKLAVGGTDALISWTAPTSTGITDYIVQYSLDNSTWTTFNDGQSISTSAMIQGLSSGYEYYVRIATVASGVTSGYSTLLTVTTDEPSRYPANPTVTVTSVSSTYANISWSQIESTVGNVIQYKVGVSTDGINYTVTTLSSLSGSATITAMKPNTKYWVYVQSRNANGYSGWAEVTFTTL